VQASPFPAQVVFDVQEVVEPVELLELVVAAKKILLL
jgi:hypothetical protein